MNTPPPQSIPAADFKPRFDTSTTAGKIAVMQEAMKCGYVYAKAKYLYMQQQLSITRWDWHVNDNSYNFPAEPRRVLVPWTKDTVPREAWIREVGYQREFKIVEIFDDEFGIHRGKYSYEYALKCVEHSLDNGKTWLPCGTWKEEV